MLPLQSPNIKWTKSVEHLLLYPFNFCSAVFVPLFLFHNFCSAIFVLLTFFHLHLGSSSPNGQESPPIFVLQFLFHWPFCTCTWGPRHPMAKSSHQFLDGLSLHLNHLIVERVSAPYWQFRTLPIGIFLSNLDSRQLETSLTTSYCHFWNLSTFGDSRAVWVFWPKLGVFRKSKFSQWRSDGASMRLGRFR